MSFPLPSPPFVQGELQKETSTTIRPTGYHRPTKGYQLRQDLLSKSTNEEKHIREGKRACQPPESRWPLVTLLEFMDTCNSRGVTRAFLASRSALLGYSKAW
ncbi:hypothetical protein EVAR_78618_1 [Eumeta japonica]|uniref:Uncharacterized protein n=1 Tax=Eumeta variegata TaxID=151549 RepID=A0A4C1U7S6_EUMVA|nr:hypothetical protein EVAR_78618_1 [Eumeta japonica]